MRKDLDTIQKNGKTQLDVIKNRYAHIKDFTDFHDLILPQPSYKLIKSEEVKWVNKNESATGYGIYNNGHLAICTANFKKGFKLAPHIHMEQEVITVSKGQLIIRIYKDPDKILSSVKPLIYSVPETLEYKVGHEFINGDYENSTDTYILDQGDFIIINPGTCHELEASVDSEFIFIAAPAIKEFPKAEIINL
jgi:quercetin dioxygenase-like cupin family protein